MYVPLLILGEQLKNNKIKKYTFLCINMHIQDTRPHITLKKKNIKKYYNIIINYINI